MTKLKTTHGKGHFERKGLVEQILSYGLENGHERIWPVRYNNQIHVCKYSWYVELQMNAIVVYYNISNWYPIREVYPNAWTIGFDYETAKVTPLADDLWEENDVFNEGQRIIEHHFATPALEA